MKKCFKCSIEKELSEFYVHKQMADGHLNKCKECTKKDSFGRTKEEIEKRKERDRNRPNFKERAIKNSQRLKDNEHLRLQSNERKKEWYQRNRNKKNANTKVARALLNGILIRPVFCQKCNLEKQIQAHHEDYSKPLDVLWLCPKCHSDRHKELNKVKRGFNE